MNVLFNLQLIELIYGIIYDDLVFNKTLFFILKYEFKVCTDVSFTGQNLSHRWKEIIKLTINKKSVH